MVETPRLLVDAAARAATGEAIDPIVFQLAIFLLAALVGGFLARPASQALHSPPAPAIYAIPSVIIVGAILSTGVDASLPGEDGPLWARLFGFIALILASVSIVGGFMLAGRLLRDAGPTR